MFLVCKNINKNFNNENVGLVQPLCHPHFTRQVAQLEEGHKRTLNFIKINLEDLTLGIPTTWIKYLPTEMQRQVV